jgi:predicted RNA-binding protein YlxR (DUF448 family)
MRTPTMPRPNEAPERTCIGCMERDSREHLLRIAVSGEMLILDEEGRLPGRGAYLHSNDRCISRFERGKAREVRSLRRKINADERRKLVELIHARLDSQAALE